jgi:D-arabinono-1,4-lactone oxidase/FAD binding domain-containing protein
MPLTIEERKWETLAAWVRRYSWATLACALWGIALAHKVLFTHRSWTTCNGVGCVLGFHLIDVPFVAALATVAIYGLLRLTRATVRRYLVLLTFSNTVQIVFFLFEITVIQAGFRAGAPATDQALLASVAAVLLLGTGLGVLLQIHVHTYLHPVEDARYLHPASERELIGLVKRARADGLKLRVRGAEHSVHAAIYADASAGDLHVQLDRYHRILAWDPARRRVTVQAGCHLGVDPHDPRSSRATSLLWQLERRGWALPDLGGITHQTVGGFLSTGSMGGTTHFDLGASVVGIRIIDGTGAVHDLHPSPPEGPGGDGADLNPFYAAGVSLGLLGVISTVTFQCIDRYDIVGKQVTTHAADAAIDLFSDDLARYFRGAQYSRILWWPQAGVDKVQLWEARRALPEDATGPGGGARRPFVSVPGGHLTQGVIKLFYDAIAHDDPPYQPATQEIIRRVLNLFLPVDRVSFRDTWLEGLPMDNQISDDLMPTEFTELFVDMAQAGAVMRALRDYYAADRDLERAGAYAVEIYPGAQSRFWMSPSYGMDTVRIDIFWFRTGRADPDRAYYPQFWELLRPFGFRFHWGKYLSDPGSSTGVAFRRAQLARWDDFLALRKRMDPGGVFLTDYWREHLGVGAVAEAQAQAPPRRGVA